jgi:hypothetical protein
MWSLVAVTWWCRCGEVVTWRGGLCGLCWWSLLVVVVVGGRCCCCCLWSLLLLAVVVVVVGGRSVWLLLLWLLSRLCVVSLQL